MPEPGGEPLTPARPDPDANGSVRAGGERSRGTLSCVVDGHPRFHLDALRWFAALTRLAQVDPADLHVCAVGSATSEVLDFLRAEGVTVRAVEPFDPRSPHCNKIVGALRLAEDAVSGTVVLCDTDTVFLEDPRDLALAPHSVAGKLVDAAVPPLEVLCDIFAAAGIPVPDVVDLPWRSGQKTVAGNFNGGLYLVPGPLLPTLAGRWSAWAHWLLDRRHLLGESAVYVDQVAMALSLTELGPDLQPLESRWNTPIHDPTNPPPASSRPAMIHYHQLVDRRGEIRSTGIDAADRAIAAVNDAARIVFDRARPDDTYRRWLSMTGQRTGRDVGGQQGAAVAALADMLRPTSILDIGPGPELPAPWERITARIDGAGPPAGPPESPRPGATTGETLADGPMQADLVVCLTQLTRQPDPVRYRDAVHRLWQASDRALVVAGYEEPPDLDDRQGSFHEALSRTLLETAPGAELYRLVDHPPLATFLALRGPGDPHPRDFGSRTLAPLADRHPDLLGLACLRIHARTTTTFYPDHAPRLWEYPTVAAAVTEHLPRGSALVDVGAGVTPLAPYLHSLGYVVDTVDPSSVRRTWPPAPDWNEWDYLDYGAAGLAHRSWNTTLEGIPGRLRFDGIYSVSVIEHVPAADRRRLLAEMSARLRPGGLAVVTIDLVRGTSDLWNRNLGVEVEDPALHGTLDGVIDEARQVGLDLLRRDTVRDWGDVAVDIGLLVFRKARAPWTVRVHREAGRWAARADVVARSWTARMRRMARRWGPRARHAAGRQLRTLRRKA